MEPSPASQRLQLALDLAESGQQAEAEFRLRALVAEGIRLPMAFMALGVLCGERGDRAQRRLWLQEARRLAEASGEPPSLRLLLNLLVDALEQGEPGQAMAYGEEALALFPHDGEAHLHQAQVHAAQGETERALSHLEQACRNLRACLATDPEDVKIWRLLAMAEKQAQRVDAAIEAYSQALAIDPNHLPTLLAVSRLLMDRGLIDQAMPWLMNALAVDPQNPLALSSTGQALREIGDALQAIELFRKALAISPSEVETYVLLGVTLSDLGLYSEAEKAFRDGLARDRSDINCRMNLATTLRNQGKMGEAVVIYREILAEVNDAHGAFSNLMFTLSISDVASPSEAIAIARTYWKGMVKEPTRSQRQTSVGRPLRVGLLSADIGSHVVGRFLDPLLRHHDPSRISLELISMQRRYEDTTETLIALADGFHSLEGLPSSQAREQLRQQNYDIILDTSGFTRGSGIHLLAERCAPVQAHYIGYHATTGLATIDWFIGDEETASPEIQEQFSERLWRLPRPWLAYPSHMEFPEATALMATPRPVLGAFSQVPKLTPTTLLFWGEALRRVPSAMLVIKDRGVADADVRRSLETQLNDLGVAPGRIAFLPPEGEWSDHVDLYNVLDIALDTTPWSSATTCFEALAMGTPMVAIRGNRMAARMSSSLLKGLGRPEWVAETPEEFATIIERMCSDLKRLRAEKKLRQEQMMRSVLFDGKNLAHHLQTTFEQMNRISNQRW